MGGEGVALRPIMGELRPYLFLLSRKLAMRARGLGLDLLRLGPSPFAELSCLLHGLHGHEHLLFGLAALLSEVFDVDPQRLQIARVAAPSVELDFAGLELRLDLRQLELTLLLL